MKNKSGKGKNILIVFLILIIIGLGSYLAYDKVIKNYLKKDNETSNVNVKETKKDNETKLTEISTDNLKVQELYNLFENINPLLAENEYSYYEFLKPTEETIKNEDLKADFKNYIAYNNKILAIDIDSSINCADYQSLNDSAWVCGEGITNEKTNKFESAENSKGFDEAKIEKAVQSIFGKDAYEKSTFYTMLSERYVYSNGKYIQQTNNGGGTGAPYSASKIDSAYKNADTYVINVLHSDLTSEQTEPEYTYKYKYTFTLDDNNNYIFESLQKEKVN